VFEWNFGTLVAIIFAIQSVTAIFLATYCTSSVEAAVDSIVQSMANLKNVLLGHNTHTTFFVFIPIYCLLPFFMAIIYMCGGIFDGLG
jgi:quinol-cytochrome oxidoreductase complex cytochrome b subunit